MSEYIHTFRVDPEDGEFVLTVNNFRRIGSYATLSEAMAALAGLMSDSATSDDWSNQYLHGAIEQDSSFNFAEPTGVRARAGALSTGTRTGYRRIASNVGVINHMYSFDINEIGDEYVLKINKTQMVGRYPTLDSAMEVLTGILTRFRADTAWIDAFIINSLESGRSHIDVPEEV